MIINSKLEEIRKRILIILKYYSGVRMKTMVKSRKSVMAVSVQPELEQETSWM
jgi:hypothetical protein